MSNFISQNRDPKKRKGSQNINDVLVTPNNAKVNTSAKKSTVKKGYKQLNLLSFKKSPSEKPVQDSSAVPILISESSGSFIEEDTHTPIKKNKTISNNSNNDSAFMLQNLQTSTKCFVCNLQDIASNSQSQKSFTKELNNPTSSNINNIDLQADINSFNPDTAKSNNCTQSDELILEKSHNSTITKAREYQIDIDYNSNREISEEVISKNYSLDLNSNYTSSINPKNVQSDNTADNLSIFDSGSKQVEYEKNSSPSNISARFSQCLRESITSNSTSVKKTVNISSLGDILGVSTSSEDEAEDDLMVSSSFMVKSKELNTLSEESHSPSKISPKNLTKKDESVNPFKETLLHIDEKNYNLDYGNTFDKIGRSSLLKKKSEFPVLEMRVEVLQRELNKATEWYKKNVILPKITGQPESNCTSFVVDAFCYGKIPKITGYFLTGMIYCSQITGNLVIDHLRVDPKYVCKLPMNWPVLIENTLVTLIDANHCPGSVLFFFDTIGSKDGYPRERILHTGDFRACPEHISLIKNTIYSYNKIDIVILKSSSINSFKEKYKTDQEELGISPETGCSQMDNEIFGFLPLTKLDLNKKPNSSAAISFENEDFNKDSELPPTINLINRIYLDTTYMKSDYAFPAQQEVVDAVVHLCKLIYNDPDERLRHVKASKAVLPSKTVVKSIHMPEDFGAVKKKIIGSFTENLTKWFKPNLFSLKSDVNKPQIKAKKSTLFVVGTYIIGKERLFIARALNSKIYVDPKKRRTLMLFEDDTLVQILTDNPNDAQVHVVPLNSIKKQLMEEYLDRYKETFDFLVAFRPTGWTFQSNIGHARYIETSNPSVNSQEKSLTDGFIPHKLRIDIPQSDERKRILHYMETIIKTGSRSPYLLSYELGSKCVPSLPPVPFTKTSIKPFGNSDRITIFPVPYSEHSSYRELAAFICSLAVDEVIPTVNYERREEAHRMNGIFDCWKQSKDFVEQTRKDVLNGKTEKKINNDNDLEIEKKSNELKGAETEDFHVESIIEPDTKSLIETKEEPDYNDPQVVFPLCSVLSIPTRNFGSYW
ncbi:DNA cross-link repair protein pso2/snm1 [Smittium mucronatum]|uniref:DNA cross-link repair protein pso2/snm1 n=1 Tax=Smittium mucronatum TaxID=133383 RepID=A0A1R0H369_9FUNG|nr:DNA cross-link repair protein pso2/snm1 [Smittium mucronatum]